MKEVEIKITNWHTATTDINGVSNIHLHVDAVCNNGIRPRLNEGKTYKLVEDDGMVTFDPSKLVNPKINESVYKLLKERISSKCNIPRIILNNEYTEEQYERFKKTLLNQGPIEILPDAHNPDFVKYIINDVKCVEKAFVNYHKHSRVMFNGRATILEIGDFKTVVKCHEDDEFNEVIGLGLALSRWYKKHSNPKLKNEVKLLEKMLSYNMFAEYCFQKYFNFDDKRIDKFVDVCMTQGKWLDL